MDINNTKLVITNSLLITTDESKMVANCVPSLPSISLHFEEAEQLVARIVECTNSCIGMSNDYLELIEFLPNLMLLVGAASVGPANDAATKEANSILKKIEDKNKKNNGGNK